MKKALVVLVLFVGYNSGLTVPSFASKLLDKSTQFNIDDLKTTTIQIDLENSKSIDEQELFQTGTDKANNLNERAFIYINQQYKPLQRNQVYNFQRYNLNRDFILNDKLLQGTVIPKDHDSMTEKKLNSIKQFFIPNIKGGSIYKSRYGSQNYIYKDRELNSRLTDDQYVHTKAVKQEIVTVKPVVVNILQKNPEEIIDQEVITDRPENTKEHCDRHQGMTPYPRHRINYNYGFPSSYSWHGPGDRINDITLRDSVIYDGSLATERGLSPLDLKDEDLLLDRYIKEALTGFDSNEILMKNEKKICKKCKKGKSDKCKCHSLSTKAINFLKSHKDKQKDGKFTSSETRASEKLHAHDNDKMMSEESIRDLLQ